MPRLVIDDLEIEVPAGTKVIEAAERLGIMIPRFCYHKALGSVGACRMCAVKFLQGPFKGVQMSCLIDAQDGMVVSTTDPDAVEFRRYMIEWLMLNHPHDCPVCDEGGQCLLQDETISGGHGLRRYAGKKRTYRDQYLGVFIQHEMNRCIHCYRCSRFYQEYAGYRDLGPLQTANRVYFGRFCDGQLESPFSGNLVDICPTGVYTDKPSRFKVRRWDLQRVPSLCTHCSLGCNTIANARHRAVRRVEGRLNKAVNGYFICDRGRFGFPYTNNPDRPRRAKIGDEEVSWEEAVKAAAEGLDRVSRDAGPGAVLCLGSTRSGVEVQSMLKRFCRIRQWPEPDFLQSPPLMRKVRTAVSRLDERVAVSLGEIEAADFILAVGVDPVNEAPMLALAMRQAFRKEATVVVMDPRPVFLPFSFEHIAVATQDLETCLSVLVKGSVGGDALEGVETGALRFLASMPAEYTHDDGMHERIAALALKLRDSRKPVIVCGTDVVRETTPSVAADCVLLLREMKGDGGLFYVMPGANAFGAALLSSSDGRYPVEVVEAIEKGTIKALMLVESDPFRGFPDKIRLEEALKRLDLLVVCDYLPSAAASYAHILLPALTMFETVSIFINQEGRLQFAAPVHGGGIPVRQMTEEGHPPHLFRSDVPGGRPRPAWQVLIDLPAALSSLAEDPQGAEISEKEAQMNDPWELFVEEAPVLSKARPARYDRIGHPSGGYSTYGYSTFGYMASGYPVSGARVLPEHSDAVPFSVKIDPEKERLPEDTLELLVVDWTFGTEELSIHSEAMWSVEGKPALRMHPKDAVKVSLSEGDVAAVHLDGGTLEIEVSLSERMARGTVILPRHRLVAWNRMKDYPVVLRLDHIEKR